LFVSNNTGTTWRQWPLTKIKGDAGAEISSGSRSIIWNVLEEFEESTWDNNMFQVIAKGNSIETVVIGSQKWTVKNLDISTYRNGETILEVKNASQWASLKTSAWCYFDNNL
jgi:hypothetical protein